MKKDDKIITIIFAAFLCAIAIGGWLLPDREFSPNENRSLQQMPELSAESLLSGSFEEAYQRYMDDQVPLRDGWIVMHTGLKLASGSKDINGVYLGSDGYLIGKRCKEDADEELFDENLQAIKNFYDRLPADVSKSVIVVPTTASIMADKLPGGAEPFDEERFAKKASDVLGDYGYVDLYETFDKEKDSNQLYYKTDHHWTTYAASLAYDKWSGTARKWTLQTLTDDFQGTLYSKVLWNSDVRDTIEGLAKEELQGIEVTAAGENIGGIYQENMLKEKDKYAVFFGGNYSWTEIKGKAGGKGRLLIIKDSFANSFAPFAALDYEKVYMTDLRYFSGNLSQRIEDEGITHVLVLQSMTAMVSDKNIGVLNNKGTVL